MRIGLITLLILLALATAMDANANAVGQGSVLAPVDNALASDADAAGLNPFHPATRAPSGRLYPLVRQPARLRPGEDSAWQLRYGLQFGGVATSGDDRLARYRRYSDMDSGAVLMRFVLDARHDDTLHYLRASGGSLGRDDGYLRVDWGRTGGFNLGLWHSNLRHVFATDARVLWDGVGSGRLTLPAPLGPGSQAAEVRDVLALRPDQELSLSREQWGLGFDVKPRRSLRLFASAALEEKTGSRPFGATMGFPGSGQFAEIIEPLDHRTTNLAGGVQWTGVRQQANLRYAASYFRNDVPALRWDNPALSPFSFFAPSSGQMALAPDNDYRSIKLDYARSFVPWRSRLTLSYADARFEQNDRLLPPTISTGMVSDGDLVNLDDWNSVAALSRATAQARRDQQLLQVKLIARPMRQWRLKLNFRDEQRDNGTRYCAFNPQTGQFGVVSLDGGLLFIPGQGGIFQPQEPGSRVRIASIPFSRDRQEAGVGLEYRFGARSTVGLSYDNTETDHRFRERAQTSDDEWNLRWTWRGQTTLRTVLRSIRRRGDDYNFNPYETFFSSSLPDYQDEFADGTSPVTLAALRKFDLASFDRERAELKWHWPIARSADLNLSGHMQQTDYVADFGLQRSDEQALTADWALRLGRRQSLYAYYSELRHDRNTAGIAASGNNTSGRGADPTAGGVNFPADSFWRQGADERHRVFGLGWKKQYERFEYRLDYTYTRSRTAVGYDFASSAALVRGIDPIEAGQGFPDLRLRHQRLEGSLRWRLRTGLALRLLYRYESEDLDDFHYPRALEPVVESFGATDLYLAAGPQPYDASLLAVLIELTPGR